MTVKNLWTFTFPQQRLDIWNKFTMIKRLTCLQAKKQVQSPGLKQVRPNKLKQGHTKNG